MASRLQEVIVPDARSQIVVVGAGVAAVRTVSALRRGGSAARIVLLGEESRPPYDRPPLSKAVLAGEREDTTLRFDPAALDVDLRLGTPAGGLGLAPPGGTPRGPGGRVDPLRGAGGGGAGGPPRPPPPRAPPPPAAAG